MTAPLKSILEAIGNTPVVQLSRLHSGPSRVFAKLEAANPLGSVKDRTALGMIEAAERSGQLKPGQTVVEATSGNTGIALAMVCARKGYPFVAVMAESFSIERRRLIRFLGAQVVLTPASEKGSGMEAKARELAALHGWFLPDQFSNSANAEIHARTTAREIMVAFPDGGPDLFVTGLGTGGTLLGVAGALRDAGCRTRIIACEPENSPILATLLDGVVPMPVGMTSHPAFRPHPMQGWTPDFVPALTREAIEKGLIDEIVGVPGAEAIATARDLARSEGILCGISGGATLAAALRRARAERHGATILAMLPDTGERYLSTPLFADIADAMSHDEIAIANSTPGYRILSGATAAATSASGPLPEPSPEASAELEQIIASREAPIVMFALEWCEFCWSLRRFFGDHGISFRSVDLDSAELRKGDRGGDLRKALTARVAAPTLPQVFVDGRHLGGATDTLAAADSGLLAEALGQAGFPAHQPLRAPAFSYLPKWVHPR